MTEMSSPFTTPPDTSTRVDIPSPSGPESLADHEVGEIQALVSELNEQLDELKEDKTVLWNWEESHSTQLSRQLAGQLHPLKLGIFAYKDRTYFVDALALDVSGSLDIIEGETLDERVRERSQQARMVRSEGQKSSTMLKALELAKQKSVDKKPDHVEKAKENIERLAIQNAGLLPVDGVDGVYLDISSGDKDKFEYVDYETAIELSIQRAEPTQQ